MIRHYSKTSIFRVSLMVLMLTLPMLIRAQPLVSEDAQWKIEINSAFDTMVREYFIDIDEDTTIFHKEYSKIRYAKPENELIWEYSGEYIRENNEKVYLFNERTRKEILLYDFSLEVDEIFYTDQCALKVTKIDTITLENGEERKRFTFEKQGFPPLETQWIEGIGSNRGLLTHFEICFEDYAESLSCYFEEDRLIYTTTTDSCASVSTSLPSLEIDQHIQLSPNPARHRVLVQSQSPLSSVLIYTTTGELIQSIRSDQLDTTIDISGLNSGTYYLLVTDMQQRRSLLKLLKI